MMSFYFSVVCLMVVARTSTAAAFVSLRTNKGDFSNNYQPVSSPRASRLRQTTDDNSGEAAAILEKVKKIRAEIAALEGKTVDDVESEAREKKQAIEQRQVEQAEARKLREEQYMEKRQSDGSFLEVPETAQDQTDQARLAVERAFADGITRQTVRFALVPEDETLNQEDRLWPGGARQMYREAAGPLTVSLLEKVKAPTGDAINHAKIAYAPNITRQDVWDFDGSALITSLSQAGPAGDVQALVQPNTDTKYLKDIQTIDAAMKDRLFLLVNPFWRDIESWGFNLLAMGAKTMAQEVIFDRGFDETYCVLQKSVRGEDCVALKAYPYDWQLYAYAEQDYWPYQEYAVRLGSTKEEPKSSDFAAFLEERQEFKMSKNMRQLQRRIGNDES